MPPPLYCPLQKLAPTFQIHSYASDMYGYYSHFLFVFIPSTCLLCLILHPFETTTKEITTTILFLADFLEEHRRVLESRLQPVIREITDSRARTREELESLYRKIVSAVLLRSGLGSPTDIAVVREATAALQSVFPQTELGTFMSLTKRDKERQLLELTMIVTGIRLFNKECGKGGEGIDDCKSEVIVLY